ncbi:MAG TPA: AraC family transcriptional regulator [Acidobacteriaceae bacterium]|jgi:AraC family transcriptional regulator|nr:AraC family transcriptional regulator [Acidobacteriaceae bacterium]
MPALISDKLGVRLQTDPVGTMESPARPWPFLVIHYGAPVRIGCERSGQAHRGLSVHGDIDIVPAGTASYWQLYKQDCALVVRLSSDLLTDAATGLGIPVSDAVLLNRFQVRDPKLEHLAWALKAEMDDGFASGSLYTESIGTAMACQLLRAHSLRASDAADSRPTVVTRAMPGFRLRRVLAYIEDNLNSSLSLSTIAAVSGLSVSHSQRAFRNATGCSLHQYVIRRRVERARSLLSQTRLPLSEVAQSVGFAHQSHLAVHMRRLFGASPAALRQVVTEDPVA